MTFTDALAEAQRYIDDNPALYGETDNERLLLHAVNLYLRAQGASRQEIDAFIELKANTAIETYNRGWNKGWTDGYRNGKDLSRVS